MPGKKSIPQIETFETLLMNSGEDFMKNALERMLNLIMELEVEAKTGCAKHERSAYRKTYRNGTRSRSLSTGVGKVTLEIPKLRNGESYYPAFLEPRRMVDKALINVIQEAYINGVSTRKIDHLVEDMGMKIDKISVPRICK
jgi:transposase-like protein